MLFDSSAILMVAQLICPGNPFFTWLSGHPTPLSLSSYFPDHPCSSPLLAPSHLSDLTLWLPQGSVFEPFFFIYTHSLGDCIQSRAFKNHLFSNNSQICLSPDQTSSLNSNSHTQVHSCASMWASNWHLKLNMLKTQPPIFQHISAPSIVVAIC